MLTTSKRWAAIVGFFIVGVAILTIGLRHAPPAVVQMTATTQDRSPEGGQPAPRPLDGRAMASRAEPPPALAEARPAAPIEPAPVAKSVQDGPHFDVVRVEPSGDSVVAGQGAPNATIDLLGSGRVLAQARTDENGHFVMVPKAFEAGNHALTLRQPSAGAGFVTSQQSVAVSVPEKGKGPVVVALAEPGAPTKLLSAPPATANTADPKLGASAPPKVPAQDVAVKTVELENGSGFYASGFGAPGAKLHVYLNNSRLADVVASAEGKWSVKIRKGLTGGHYMVRADASPDGIVVTSRAEVPFDVPVAMAETKGSSEGSGKGGGRGRGGDEAAAAAQPHLDAAPPSATDAVIDEVSTAAVHVGDNLWEISRIRLGQGRRYTRIYAANLTQIRDPRLIYPGQVLVLPSRTD